MPFPLDICSMFTRICKPLKISVILCARKMVNRKDNRASPYTFATTDYTVQCTVYTVYSTVCMCLSFLQKNPRFISFAKLIILQNINCQKKIFFWGGEGQIISETNCTLRRTVNKCKIIYISRTMRDNF